MSASYRRSVGFTFAEVFPAVVATEYGCGSLS